MHLNPRTLHKTVSVSSHNQWCDYSLKATACLRMHVCMLHVETFTAVFLKRIFLQLFNGGANEKEKQKNVTPVA